MSGVKRFREPGRVGSSRLSSLTSIASSPRSHGSAGSAMRSLSQHKQLPFSFGPPATTQHDACRPRRRPSSADRGHLAPPPPVGKASPTWWAPRCARRPGGDFGCSTRPALRPSRLPAAGPKVKTSLSWRTSTSRPDAGRTASRAGRRKRAATRELREGFVGLARAALDSGAPAVLVLPPLPDVQAAEAVRTVWQAVSRRRRRTSPAGLVWLLAELQKSPKAKQPLDALLFLNP